jgi:hypothetical protein
VGAVSVVPAGPEGWIPGRGDYGTEYSSDLIEIVERLNCVKGCTKAGGPAEREEFGPGGNCHTLALIGADVPIPELEPRPDGPHCTAREDPAVAGMDALFGEVTG